MKRQKALTLKDIDDIFKKLEGVPKRMPDGRLLMLIRVGPKTKVRSDQRWKVTELKH